MALTGRKRTGTQILKRVLAALLLSAYEWYKAYHLQKIRFGDTVSSARKKSVSAYILFRLFENLGAELL